MESSPPIDDFLDDDIVPIPAGIWEWNQHSTQRRHPPDQAIVLGENKRPIPHGTYKTRPYYAFIEASKPGQPGERTLFLVSDCGLRAELIFIKGTLKGVQRGALGWACQFRILIPGKEADPNFKDAILSYDLTPYDGKEEHIFVVTGTPADFEPLPSGSHDAGRHYITSEKWEPNQFGNTDEYSSQFILKPASLDLLRRAWDVRAMDLVDFNFQTTGSGTELFAEPPKHSLDYYKADNHYFIPYGWAYGLHAGGVEHETLSMVSKSTDVANSVLQSTGFHVSGSGGSDVPLIVSAEVDFSVMRNKELTSKIREVGSLEKTFVEKNILHTENVLLLDKQNVTLTKAFIDKVDELRAVAAKGPLTAEVLEGFFGQFGTHYAYAAILGAKGRVVTTISQETIAQVVETGEKAQEKWEVGAKVTILGGLVSASLRGGQDTSSASGQDKKWESAFKSQDTYIVTYGGSGGANGAPGSDYRIPVLMDLRPISDLFGVPFFTDEKTAIALHDQIAEAVVSHAFSPHSKVAGPEKLGFRKITFDPLRIEVATPRTHPQLIVPCNRPGREVLERTGLDFIGAVMPWLDLREVTIPIGAISRPEIKGAYLDPLQILDPIHWKVRMVVPNGTCVSQAGSLAWPPRVAARTNWWHLEKIDKYVAPQRANSQSVDLSPAGGSSVLLSPNMPRPSSVKIGFDLLFDPNVKLSEWEPMVLGTFFEQPDRTPIMTSGGLWQPPDPSSMQDLVGPSSVDPDAPVRFEFAIEICELTLSGIDKQPLQFPITVTVSGRIQRATVNELLKFDL